MNSGRGKEGAGRKGKLLLLPEPGPDPAAHPPPAVPGGLRGHPHPQRAPAMQGLRRGLPAAASLPPSPSPSISFPPCGRPTRSQLCRRGWRRAPALSALRRPRLFTGPGAPQRPGPAAPSPRPGPALRSATYPPGRGVGAGCAGRAALPAVRGGEGEGGGDEEEEKEGGTRLAASPQLIHRAALCPGGAQRSSRPRRRRPPPPVPVPRRSCSAPTRAALRGAPATDGRTDGRTHGHTRSALPPPPPLCAGARAAGEGRRERARAPPRPFPPRSLPSPR